VRRKSAIGEFMIDRLESATSYFDRSHLVHSSLSLSTPFTFVDAKGSFLHSSMPNEAFY